MVYPILPPSGAIAKRSRLNSLNLKIVTDGQSPSVTFYCCRKSSSIGDYRTKTQINFFYDSAAKQQLGEAHSKENLKFFLDI
jgi:hypothetical protein